jgi:uncharacterized membrane protein YccC
MENRVLQGSVFSLRTFCAAMLAGWLALRLSLSSPGTAMMTAYMVAQPFVGATLSKGLYRMLGNLLGGAAALLFFALFAQTRELFALAMVSFFAACIYLANFWRDRPEAFAPLLAGYTATFIAFPIIDSPEDFFAQATNRVCEVGIAIVCTSLLSAVVLPRHMGPLLRTRIDALLNSLTQWGKDVCAGKGREVRSFADRSKMVAAAIELDGLRLQALYDSPSIRASNAAIRQLEGRVLTSLALLASIESFERNLRVSDPARRRALAPAFAAVNGILGRPLDDPEPEDRQAVREARALISSLKPRPEEAFQDDLAVLADTTLQRLDDVLTIRNECRELRRQIATGAPSDISGPSPSPGRDRDYAGAAIAAMSAFTGLLAACTFWILSGWPNGSSTGVFVAATTALTSTADDPTLPLKNTLMAASAAFIVAAIYFAFILSRLDGFVMLAAALALVLLPAGYLMTKPKVYYPMYVICVFFPLFLQLTDHASQDFASFLNVGTADLAGIAIAILMARLTRPIGAHWVVKRLLARIYQDLSRVTAGSDDTFTVFASRMFDRINGLFTRLDPESDQDHLTLQGGLAVVRVGYNVITLHGHLRSREMPASSTVKAALAALSRHLRMPRRDGASGQEAVNALSAAETALRKMTPDRDVVAMLELIIAIRSLLGSNPDFFGLRRADDLLPQPNLIVQT